MLAYYFPPLGGSGVQRVASLVRHLPTFGWQPTVVSVRPGTYIAYDDGLAHDVAAAGVEVIRTASVDPTRTGQGGGSLPSGRAGRVLGAITRWGFVPDNKIGWAPFAAAAALRAHRVGAFDVVYASAPPYTALLVAAWLSRRWSRPLVLDLRDDWLGNPRHVYPTRLHRWLHARLERHAVRQAAALLVISEAMGRAVAARHPDLNDRVHVVPQGYEPDDFPSTPEAVPAADGRFRIVYTGMFYDVQRPDTFLAALATFVEQHPGVSVQADFYGHVPAGMADRVRSLGLAGVVRVHGYRPHRDVVRAIADASMLWMTVGHRPGADGISTGKLYEYVGSRRPVLGLVPVGGTAAATLRAYGRGWVADPDDEAGAARALGEIFRAWRAGTLPAASETLLREHDRQRIAGTVARLLGRLSEE